MNDRYNHNPSKWEWTTQDYINDFDTYKDDPLSDHTLREIVRQWEILQKEKKSAPQSPKPIAKKKSTIFQKIPQPKTREKVMSNHSVSEILADKINSM